MQIQYFKTPKIFSCSMKQLFVGVFNILKTFYKRYVNKFLCIRVDLQELSRYLNSEHNNINFILESKNVEQIIFWLLCSRDDQMAHSRELYLEKAHGMKQISIHCLTGRAIILMNSNSCEIWSWLMVIRSIL